MIRRREFLISAGAGVGALALGPARWQKALAAASNAQTGPGPYGDLLAPDANGVRIPQGFSSRVIARGGLPVGRRAYPLPIFPDGATTFATPDGGWILVANSEVPGAGGASAIRFTATGEITDAYSVLAGTSTNCAGGRTPWGTWLSGEEVDTGYIWECDPTGATPAQRRDALGRFKHEAACVDPVEGRVYLTEDLGDGGFYRFTPGAYPDLSTGVLEIATVAADNSVTWNAVNPTPAEGEAPTRQQVAGSTQFKRGEGIWYDAGTVYVATTSDDTIHSYDVASRTMGIVYRRENTIDSPLQGVDNITVSRSGDLFVCEDSYDNDPDAMDVCLISREGTVSRFAKLTGPEHFLPNEAESEITGVCFDPSGQRMYFSSQRAAGMGAIYEVSGPFRLDRPGDPPRTNASNPLGAAIGVELAQKAPLALMTGTGLPIAIVLDEPATVTAVLTERSRGSRRHKPKVVASKTLQLPRGRSQVQLVAKGRKRRAALRRRRRMLKGDLQLSIAAGASRTAVGRRVKLTV